MILTVLQLGLATTILSLVSFPLIWRFFKGSAVAIAVLSAFFTLILSVFSVYVLVSLGVFDFSRWLFWVMPVCIGFVSWWTVRKSFDEFRLWLHNASRTLLLSLTLFLSLLTVFVVLKSHSPEIYQIERFMDYGFIAALENTSTLPLNDIWLSGESLNYYYFGHLMAYMMIVVSALQLEPGFFAMQAWLFAMLFMASFAAALEFIRFAIPRQLNQTQLNFALISAWVTVFGGGLFAFLHKFRELFLGEDEGFWYAVPARIIDGAITEFPIFSFIASDLHAHTWGLLFAAIAMLFGAMLVRTFEDEKSFKVRYFTPQILLAALLIATAFMTNAWDVITVGSVISLLMLRAVWRFMGVKALWLIALVGALAFTLSQVWYLPYEPPLTGISYVEEQSNVWQWYQFWFLPVTIVLISLAARWSAVHTWAVTFKRDANRALSCMSPVVLPILLSVFLWMVMELFYFEDILLSGEWFRANTVFKLTSQAWVFLGISAGPLLAMIWQGKASLMRHASLAAAAVVIVMGSFYAFRALPQGLLDGERTGLDGGFYWIEKNYPDDYNVLRLLQNDIASLDREERQDVVLLEAEGESYKDNARVSVFTGLKTVVGYPVHEWTWRGSYDEVGARRADVRRAYTSSDLAEVQEILGKYSIDIVMIGQLEREYYPELANGSSAILDLKGATLEVGNSKVIFIN